jgi:hypothetical protein
MIRFEGWIEYEPARAPALWMRVAAQMSDLLKNPPDGGWLAALQEYGPLDDTSLDETPRDERVQRDSWGQAIQRLDEVSLLWREGDMGVWALPESPVELTRAYRLLQVQLRQVAGVVDKGVRLALRGIELVPEPATLEAYLWLSAAESVRDRHRFKKCERCAGWFAIRRTYAQFCSASCRNWRPAPSSDEAAAAEE